MGDSPFSARGVTPGEVLHATFATPRKRASHADISDTGKRAFVEFVEALKGRGRF